MQPILKTHGLTKRYGEKIAANNINMTVYRGDIYGFIGKNGAGKTTTMKMILGTNLPTSGKIELFGGKKLSEARRKTGSLLEAPGLYKNCTAKENMRRFALLSNSSDEKIDEILSLVGLSQTGSKKAGQFSLGMKQRLGIAIALLGDPEFLVLDEPINGLDPEGIKAIRDLILRLNREKGVTFLISSHLIDELAKIVTRYGIINNGDLVEEIGAAELESKISGGTFFGVDDPAKASTVIAHFAGADNIETREGGVLMRCDHDDVPSIVEALVRSGVRIREVARKANSFEEYFIERIAK